MSLNESIVEDVALERFGELGDAVGHGPRLAPGESAAARDSIEEVIFARHSDGLVQGEFLETLA